MAGILLSRRSALGAAAQLFVEDTFTRSDGGLNGSTTTTGAKTWAAAADLIVTSNKLGCTSGAASEILGDVDYGTANHRAVITVSTFGNNFHTGLTVRKTDASNFYYIGVNAAGADSGIYKKVGGNFTLLVAASGATFVAGDILGLGIVDSTITAYRNGASISTVSDSSLTTGNLVGVRLNAPGAAVRADDFAVYAS